jgi:hypothetical protein
MLTYGKSYIVTPRTGVSNIYRSEKLVGTHPEMGFSVQVFGVCTALAGTELAAHALAEVHKDVPSHKRLWVLTADEYEEHRRILQDNLDDLMETYPFSDEEKAAVDASNARYAKYIEQSNENMKRKLMNVSPYEFVTQRPNLARPSTFPGQEEEEQTPGMRF